MIVWKSEVIIGAGADLLYKRKMPGTLELEGIDRCPRPRSGSFQAGTPDAVYSNTLYMYL